MQFKLMQQTDHAPNHTAAAIVYCPCSTNMLATSPPSDDDGSAFTDDNGDNFMSNDDDNEYEDDNEAADDEHADDDSNGDDDQRNGSDRFLQYGSFDEVAGETDQADVLVGGQTYGGTGQP